ncbi:hypothetical protein KW782_04225 [Candidatus Parcubacteria bacterium]|nr:hypothetical protein [Candidatus Parcubacteria bacterium]
MLDTLEKIFGSGAKVKILRLFLFNPTEGFDIDQIAERAKVTPAVARYETALLQKAGVIKRKSFFRDFIVGRKKEIERRRVSGWTLHEEFEYLEPLTTLLEYISAKRNQEIIKTLSRAGKLKLVIISGFFIRNRDSRVDMLIVGDDLKRGKLEQAIKLIESEFGREIRYAAFETADFRYRLGVYDKLIRDILDFPHEAILDKLGLQPIQPIR